MSLYKGSQRITPIFNIGSVPTLTTKTITSNGTYNASSDNADGYSSVTVSVPEYQPTNNITVVGTLTENNGVFSGFGASNYLNTQCNLDLYSLYTSERNCSIEFKIKITTASSFAEYERILGCIANLGAGINILLNNGKLQTWMTNNGTSWNISAGTTASTALSVSTTYFIKFTSEYYSDNYFNYSVAYSEDDSYYINAVNISLGTAFKTVYPYTLGCGPLDNPFLGSIDLNGSYIKKNNIYLWKGRI